MIRSNKKICLIYCGALKNLNEKGFLQWVKDMPELGIVARLEPIFLYGDDTADITPQVWMRLALEIEKRYKKFDGFVVMHGSDNLLFTGSAISFLIQNISKSILFTSGVEDYMEKPSVLATKNIGLKTNLIDAMQFATFGLPEIGLIYGNRFFRANQSRALHNGSLNIYDAPLRADLGKIDFSIRMYDRKSFDRTGQLRVAKAMSDNIEIVKVTPHFNAVKMIKRAEELDGMMFDLTDYRDIPEKLLEVLDRMSPRIPVVLFWPIDTKRIVKEKNVSVVSNMTYESTVTKLMWALGLTNEASKVKRLMSENVAGEIL